MIYTEDKILIEIMNLGEFVCDTFTMYYNSLSNSKIYCCFSFFKFHINQQTRWKQ